MPFNTPITRLLDVKIPVVAAPMAGASGGLLAARVTAAGGFGFLTAGYKNAKNLIDELARARQLLHLSPSNPLPVGVGYLCWQLEQPTAEPEILLSAALDNHVQAIWLAFGNDIKKWIKFIRNYDVERKRVRQTTIFVQVSSTEEALVASNEWKADVIVAQGLVISYMSRRIYTRGIPAGNESGGHGYGAAPPLFTLVSSILAALPRGGPPVLAAGGLVTGSQVASFLVLGAAGAVLGTRFLLTPESLYSDAQKKALAAARSDMTVRTMAFDRARGTLEWPAGVDGRGLYNDTVKDLDEGVDIETVKEKFRAGIRDADPNRMLVWSGMGIGLVSEIKSAEEVVQELGNDITQRLKAASELAR